MEILEINDVPFGKGTNPNGGRFTRVKFASVGEAKEFGFEKTDVKLYWHTVRHVGGEPRMGDVNPLYSNFCKLCEEKNINIRKEHEKYNIKKAQKKFIDIGEEKFEQLREVALGVPYISRDLRTRYLWKEGFRNSRSNRPGNGYDAFAVRVERERREIDTTTGYVIGRHITPFLFIIGRQLIEVIDKSEVVVSGYEGANLELIEDDIWKSGKYVPLRDAFEEVWETLG